MTRRSTKNLDYSTFSIGNLTIERDFTIVQDEHFRLTHYSCSNIGGSLCFALDKANLQEANRTVNVHVIITTKELAREITTEKGNITSPSPEVVFFEVRYVLEKYSGFKNKVFVFGFGRRCWTDTLAIQSLDQIKNTYDYPGMYHATDGSDQPIYLKPEELKGLISLSNQGIGSSKTSPCFSGYKKNTTLSDQMKISKIWMLISNLQTVSIRKSSTSITETGISKPGKVYMDLKYKNYNV